MRKITKRSAAVITAAVLGVGAAGAAWAAWLSADTAEVSGAAGKAGTVDVVSATVDGALAPGNPGDLKIEIKNNNEYGVRLTNLTFGAFSSTETKCDAAGTFALNGNPNTSLASFGVLGKGETFTYVFPDGVKLTADPDNDCQGAPFKFEVTAEASSAES